ncbi:MAG TPA: DUF1707 domain-containing protein [Streptosporangiaceae bacterium]|nr:DUF1707 domain-containing protein [Streptosporangiaceae bacterium]
MNPDQPGDVSRMRISDAERDQAASVLSDALAEGRLTAEEHAERLDAIYAARTHADIVPVLSDLPGHSTALRPAGLSQRAAPVPAAAAGSRDRIICVFSGTDKKGAWQVPGQIETIAVFGGAALDLREAVLPGREIRIRAICVFGGVDITVPPEMHVVDSGFSLFGGRDVSSEADESVRPDAPVLYVHGICVFGGISVRRKRRKNDRAPKELRPGSRSDSGG